MNEDSKKADIRYRKYKHQFKKKGNRLNKIDNKIVVDNLLKKT
jgi:hypothetical protein